MLILGNQKRRAYPIRRSCTRGIRLGEALPIEGVLLDGPLGSREKVRSLKIHRSEKREITSGRKNVKVPGEKKERFPIRPLKKGGREIATTQR